MSPLELTRDQILAYRRRVNALDERMLPGPDSLRAAALAGLTDSVPRAALLSIHARVDHTAPDVLDDPNLIQLWGPRFSAYVVYAQDRAVFTLGRLPESGERLRRAREKAAQLHAYLDGRRMSYGEAGRALGIDPNSLRYAAPTGTVLIRWDGARQPVIWTVPAPDVDPRDARLELARRYLQVFGPGTAPGFGAWAGIRPPGADSIFRELAPEATTVRTPIGDARILSRDEQEFRKPAGEPAPARLLPSGDAFYLLQGREREFLVPDAARRTELWTSRVWPGALLVDGEVAGTWRRADADISLRPWRALSPDQRSAVEAEAAALPLPGLVGRIRVRWDGLAVGTPRPCRRR